MSNDLQTAVAKLSLKRDDILLVDTRRVNVALLPLIATEVRNLVIPVLCKPGETPDQAFAAMSEAQAVALLEAIVYGSQPQS